jgi:ribonuclease T1
MAFLKNFFLLFLLLTGTFYNCQPSEKTTQNQENGAYQEQKEDDSTEKPHKKHRKRHKRDRNEDENAKYGSENRTDTNTPDIRTGDVPTKALKVLKYVRENGVAMDGYVGGRRFGNFEGLLPKKDKSGKRIDYQEWDVNPKIQGKNRGTERLITGSDGKGYYTGDHYGSFTEINQF